MPIFNVIIKDIIQAGFFLSLLINAILFIPQAWILYKNKQAKNVSLSTFFGFNVIQGFSILHAFIIKDWIFFIGMILSFITCGCVTLFAFLYRNNG